MLGKGTAVTFSHLTPGGRAQLSAPAGTAGRWASVIARSGDVVIAAAAGAAAAADGAAGAVAAPAGKPCAVHPTAAGGASVAAAAVPHVEVLAELIATARGADGCITPHGDTPAAAAAAAVSAGASHHAAGGWTAVLVRTHNPTPAALRRITDWAAELDAAPADKGRWQLWVQADVSECGGRRPAAAELLSSLRGAANGRVHALTEDAMAAAFPALRCVPLRKPGGRATSLAYGFHCEAAALWWRAHGAGCRAVWVMEDDVGCSGPLLSLLGAYSVHAGDLVTHRWATRHHSWHWRDAVSPGFAACCPHLSQQLFSREHVQRWSAALLAAMDALSAAGACAWSEMATPSLCRRLGLQEGLLMTRHLGEKFAFNTRVREDEWAGICAADAAASGGRLYHALKW